MKNTLKIAPAAVVGLALTVTISIFILWKYTNGYPYLYQNEESYLSYVHAWFLNYDHPLTFSFLTREEFNAVYTHNPNMPRYAHYLLMKLGVFDFTYQLLIISTISTVSSILLFYWSFQSKIHDFFIIFLSLIFFILNPQFVMFSHNSYRVFSFVLFTLMIYSVYTRKNKLIAISSLILFQFEYAFAIFTTGTCLAYMMFDGVRKNKDVILWLLIGAAISIAIFFLQIVSYQSFDKLIDEMFHIVLPHRGIGERSLIETLLTLKYILNNTGKNYWLMYVISLSIAAVGFLSIEICKRIKLDLFLKYETVISQLYFPSRFLYSVFIGGILATILLPGYCVDAYGNYRLPFACFHELAIFVFFISVCSSVFQIFLGKYYTKLVNIILLSCVSVYPILQEIEQYKVYIPHGYHNINKGEYITLIKKYKNKHYITNFPPTAAFRDSPRPNPLAYGLGSIQTAIIEYKNNFPIRENNALYYICIQQPGYDCKLMTYEIQHAWPVNLIAQKKDYVIIEFPPNFSRELVSIKDIDDASWVELALNLYNGTSAKDSLSNTLQVRNLLLAGSQSPFPLNPNSPETYQAFKEMEGALTSGSSSFTMEQSTLQKLKEKYPQMWRVAMVSAISKLLSKKSEEESFCTQDIIEKALTNVNKLNSVNTAEIHPNPEFL